MFLWLIKKLFFGWRKRKKNKRKKKIQYARNRRIWDHEANILMDTMLADRSIKRYEINRAIVRAHEDLPEPYWGCIVEVQFYGDQLCEISLPDEQQMSFPTYIQTIHLDFSPSLSLPSVSASSFVGTYVILLNDIESDDEIKEVLGQAGDEVLVFYQEETSAYPIGVQHGETYACFRVKVEEVKLTEKRLPIEII